MTRTSALQAAAALLLMLCAGRVDLSAQRGGETLQQWELTHLRGGWCMAFLMAPEEARRQLRGSFAPVAAADLPGVHPALLRTVQEESQYSGWIPARVCFYQFDTVRVDGRDRFEDGRLPDLNRTQVLGIWGVAARDTEHPEQGTAFFVQEFRTRDGGLQAVARRASIRVENMRVKMGRMPDTEENRWRYEFGKTSLTWDGHPSPDSTASTEPDSTEWVVRSLHGSELRAMFSWDPGTAHSMVGAVSIQGKDDLAKALGASPIRMVGPLYLEGSGRLIFYR